MLIDWIGSKRKTNAKQGEKQFPHPATLNSTVRAFLAATKDMYNWHFTLADFKFDGGFNAFFKTLCAQRQKEYVSVSVIFCFLLCFKYLPKFVLLMYSHHMA